jgi:hypothetical protein
LRVAGAVYGHISPTGSPNVSRRFCGSKGAKRVHRTRAFHLAVRRVGPSGDVAITRQPAEADGPYERPPVAARCARRR